MNDFTIGCIVGSFFGVAILFGIGTVLTLTDKRGGSPDEEVHLDIRG